MHQPLPGPVVHPPRGDTPVLLSIPHAGRDYPDWLIEMTRSGQKSLHPLEDPLVDRLAWRALGHGAGAVIAQAPRAAVDCNRAEDEVDPALIGCGMRTDPRKRPSARARGGLGIVPSRTALHGHLWRRGLSADELEQRLAQAHRPYHRAVARNIEAVAERFGCALLLDCHSMPPLPKGGAQIVFGDRYGRSAAPWVAAEACSVAAELGFDSAVNEPFAGGHVVEHHGAPHLGIHALQVEIDRSCYLGRDGQPSAGFDGVSRLLEQLTLRLGNRAFGARASRSSRVTSIRRPRPRALATGDGRLALLGLTLKHIADLRQREQVREQQREHAVLVHLAQLVAAKLAELLLIDHPEAAEDERLLRSPRAGWRLRHPSAGRSSSVPR